MTYEELEKIRKDINSELDSIKQQDIKIQKEMNYSKGMLIYKNKAFRIEIDLYTEFIQIINENLYGFEYGSPYWRFLEACLKFVKIPFEDRGDVERTFRFEVFEEVDIEAGTKEEAEEKLEKMYQGFFYDYKGTVDKNGDLNND